MRQPGWSEVPAVSHDVPAVASAAFPRGEADQLQAIGECYQTGRFLRRGVRLESRSASLCEPDVDTRDPDQCDDCCNCLSRHRPLPSCAHASTDSLALGCPGVSAERPRSARRLPQATSWGRVGAAFHTYGTPLAASRRKSGRARSDSRHLTATSMLSNQPEGRPKSVYIFSDMPSARVGPAGEELSDDVRPARTRWSRRCDQPGSKIVP